ncbi:MAG: glycosyltransferase, partial [Solirubrobacterales bacterium]|nr:glycosyltransferase [Solirubrobacterales bacterium]
MTRVVSVTRLGVRRDKRTFQIAASMSRRGFQSAVVEGERSSLDREDLPFDLITVEGAEPLRAPDAGDGDGPEAVTESARRAGSLAHRVASRVLAPRTLRRLFLADNELTYRALPDADLYYLTCFWQFPAVWRKCRENGARFVYDANDAYWLWPGYAWYPRLFRAYLRLIERRCVRRAAGFVTVSEGVAALLEERYGRRPDVVRNMHDLRMDEESDVDVRAAAGLGESDFAVVIVGNEKPSDAVEEPIRALGELPDRVHLVCLGAGYDKHLPLARELGVSERVHVIPPVPPVHVTSAIRSADACLVNIRSGDVHRFALPTRFFSAVAAGLPVLHPPLPEVRA